MADPKVNINAEQPDAVVHIQVANEGAPGYTPQRGVDYWTDEDKQEIRDYVDERIGQAGGTGGSGGVSFTTDDTLSLIDGVLSVNTTDAVEEDNTLPVTSAAVYAEVGNINALLETI